MFLVIFGCYGVLNTNIENKKTKKIYPENHEKFRKKNFPES